MLINWTKIIILIIIIGAFTGVIVGIVIAFRSQCPDGKIYNKTCKKCVTKCEDGYNLPTKDGGIDCNSGTCLKDCGDKCRVDDDTCGEKCGGGGCCDTNNSESCDWTTDVCRSNNCGDKYCTKDEQCIKPSTPGGEYSCSGTTKSCSTPGFEKNCDNGQCCPKDKYCTKNNDGITYCCQKDEVAAKNGCCSKSNGRYNPNDDICCAPNATVHGKECCLKANQCGDSECCSVESKTTCNKDIGKCVIPCPGATPEYCLPTVKIKGKTVNQICETGEDGNPSKCVTDPCEWGTVDYNPPMIDNKLICKWDTSGGTDCSGISLPPGIEGVWKPDWEYNTGSPGGQSSKVIDNACAISTTTSPQDYLPQCNKNGSDFCEGKLGGAGVTTTDFNEKTGVCNAHIDCLSYWKTPGMSQPTKAPNAERCLLGGVCCKPTTKDGAGGKCGTWCLPDDEYCKLDPNTEKTTVLCNGNANPTGTESGLSSKDPNWTCSDNCKPGWSGDQCQTETCKNVTCGGDCTGTSKFWCGDYGSSECSCYINDSWWNPADHSSCTSNAWGSKFNPGGTIKRTKGACCVGSSSSSPEPPGGCYGFCPFLHTDYYHYKNQCCTCAKQSW